MVNICVGCGKRTRLTWPKGKASFCKMKCAANNFVALVSAGCDYGFCQTCGNESWICGGCLPKEDEEEDEEDESGIIFFDFIGKKPLRTSEALL